MASGGGGVTLPELETGFALPGTPAAAVGTAPAGEALSATGLLSDSNTGMAAPSADHPVGASDSRTAGPVSGAAQPVCVPARHPRRSAEVTPLSPDRYKYQLTIGGSTLEKLRLAKDMLRHALPSGDDEAILDR